MREGSRFRTTVKAGWAVGCRIWLATPALVLNSIYFLTAMFNPIHTTHPHNLQSRTLSPEWRESFTLIVHSIAYQTLTLVLF